MIECDLNLRFQDLIMKGDNVSVMHSIMTFGTPSSRLGHVLLDIQSSLSRTHGCLGFRSHIQRGYFVAQFLARYVRQVSHDVVWIRTTLLRFWNLYILI